MILLTHFSFISFSFFSRACSIESEDSVVVTGGQSNGGKTVSLYDVGGWKSDLPDLNQGRYDHGCGGYVDSNNNKV